MKNKRKNILLIAGILLALLVGIDLLRRRRMEKEQSSDREDLLAQLEALKAEIAAGTADAAAAGDGTAGTCAASVHSNDDTASEAPISDAANRTANAQADTADEPNYTADVRANEADKPNHTSDVQADHTADVQSNSASADTAGTPAGSAK